MRKRVHLKQTANCNMRASAACTRRLALGRFRSAGTRPTPGAGHPFPKAGGSSVVLATRCIGSFELMTQSTPNPKCMKFVPADGRLRLLRPRNGRVGSTIQIKPGSDSAAILQDLAAPSILQKLQERRPEAKFTNALVADDFISVTLDEEVDDDVWDEIGEGLQQSLQHDLGDGKWQTILAGSDEAQPSEKAPEEAAEDDVEVIIQEILDERIRPNLQMDGGDVEYRGFDAATGTVKLRLVGACVSCPSSTVTMRFSIKNLLVHMLDEVKEVEQVFDEEDLVPDFGESWTG